MNEVLFTCGTTEIHFRNTSDESLWPGDDIDAESLSHDPSIEDFIAVRGALDARDAHQERMAQCFENGIRTVERCQLIKSKAGRQYRQKPEHGRGKGKRTKQWDVS